MKLRLLPSISMRWIVCTCLAGFLFPSALQAQQAPSEPQTSQSQESQPEPQARQTQPAQETTPSKDIQQEVQVNDHSRTFLVHLPQGYDSQQHYPVVILLHSFDQEAAEVARLTHFDQFADSNGIIAIYPNALNGRWNLGGGEPRPYRQRGPYRRRGWGGYPPPERPAPSDRGEGRAHNQDMQFFHRMLEKAATRYSVDTHRIYAVGFGEGGFMALRMGCNMADRIAAIAVVAAAMPKMLTCVPSRAISALLMDGTDDPIVHYDGGRYRESMLHLLSAEDSAKEWGRLNHCSEKPAESKLPSQQQGGKDTKVYLFNDCERGSQVVLYGVKGGGHTWPGGEQYLSEKEVGKTSNALNANETIWSFLVTKKIADETGSDK
jgi:polyhydroxybutyrate depolymerase